MGSIRVFNKSTLIFEIIILIHNFYLYYFVLSCIYILRKNMIVIHKHYKAVYLILKNVVR